MDFYSPIYPRLLSMYVFECMFMGVGVGVSRVLDYIAPDHLIMRWPLVPEIILVFLPAPCPVLASKLAPFCPPWVNFSHH